MRPICSRTGSAGSDGAGEAGGAAAGPDGPADAEGEDAEGEGGTADGDAEAEGEAGADGEAAPPRPFQAVQPGDASATQTASSAVFAIFMPIPPSCSVHGNGLRDIAPPCAARFLRRRVLS
jgi:hypothetical protein